MAVCIYTRCSTKAQDLEAQLSACRKYCEYKGYEVVAEYAEKVSGSGKVPRPEYSRMLRALRNREYDGVVVFRLDRLGRNARELSLLLEEFEHKGIGVYSATESYDTSTAIGRAMREMVFIFAQLEREQISEATTARLAAVKASGKRLGRKPGSRDRKRRCRSGYIQRWLNKRGANSKASAVGVVA
jgi:site-specific DNA recombinase